MKAKIAAALKNLGAYNKALIAALGGVVIIVNEGAGVVHGTWSTGVLAVLTAASVFLVKNQNLIDEAGDIAGNVLDH